MDIAPTYGITERADSPSDADRHAERIRLRGFTVVDGGFSGDELTALAEGLDGALARQASRSGGLETLEAIGEHDTLRCCLAHDDIFLPLATNEAVLGVCRRLLGDYVVLTQQNGIVNPAKRAHTQTALHRDIPYQHFVSSRPIAVSALFCLDPFTSANGATIVLPGTHRMEQFPSEAVARELETTVEAPRGSYLVFDSMLFHRAGRNTTDQPRRAVNHVFGLPFMAPQISIPDLLQGRYADDPALHRLLGYGTVPPRSLEAWWAGRRDRRPPGS
jgi:ectoine hydroxylase-related dioxygenase (phytanoyl-CoA dioxygenase family)